MKPPYPVYNQSSYIHNTYLDTVGRPVIVAKGYNLVEQHIMEFEVMLFCFLTTMSIIFS